MVERPASAVKELVENSIDAEATSITIEIENGGLSRIRVTDNGAGMSADDALLAFERHATSKINGADDLDAISTLGFRGEALASIAAVSKIRLETVRRGFSEGIFVQLEAGSLVSQGIIGRPSGTSIDVEELFYNTPARLKYMKSPQAESSRIKDVVDRFVLGYPCLSFRYINAGKQILYSPGTGRLDEAIVAVYGHEAAGKMLFVEYEWQGVKVSGYIGLPEMARANRTFQTFFVNGRYVRSPILSRALEEAFSTLVMVNRFPMCIINLELDPHCVDVNVHPAKIEVRFVDERKIAAVLFHAVKRALSSGGLLGKDEHKVDLPISVGDGHVEQSPIVDGTNGTTQRASFDSLPYHQEKFLQRANVHETPDSYDSLFMRVIGILFSTYLLVEKADQLCIIDQHAAHERILYERYMSILQNQSLQLQYLASPLVLEMSVQERQLIAENIELLRSMGFEIEEFGTESYVLRAVPTLFGQPQAESLLKDIIDGMKEFDRNSPYDYRREAVMMLACRSAIKANDYLSEMQAAKLADEILSGAVPPTCPHGRPIVHVITKHELEKMFKRVQ